MQGLGGIIDGYETEISRIVSFIMSGAVKCVRARHLIKDITCKITIVISVAISTITNFIKISPNAVINSKPFRCNR